MKSNHTYVFITSNTRSIAITILIRFNTIINNIPRHITKIKLSPFVIPKARKHNVLNHSSEDIQEDNSNDGWNVPNSIKRYHNSPNVSPKSYKQLVTPNRFALFDNKRHDSLNPLNPNLSRPTTIKTYFKLNFYATQKLKLKNFILNGILYSVFAVKNTAIQNHIATILPIVSDVRNNTFQILVRNLQTKRLNVYYVKVTMQPTIEDVPNTRKSNFFI